MNPRKVLVPTAFRMIGQPRLERYSVAFCYEWMSRQILSARNKVSVFRDGFFAVLKGRASVNIYIDDWNYYKYMSKNEHLSG